ncbi:MAG: class II aldolase/adducin family protein [Oscillospiraceae bacterium]|nr:class II aldolase/adducin family protein [Oscillospiraceae bacterium]
MNFAAELAKFSRIAEEKGLVDSIEGNLSMMDRSTGNIYITPSHKAKLLLTEDDICVVNPAGTQIGGTGKKSSEYFLHEAAYAARPDIGAVFHCHAPYLTAYALAYRDFIPPADTALSHVFSEIKCLPYGAFGTHAIHQGIEEALDGRPAALLGGHGVVCVGVDPEEAIGLLEAAENFAKTLAIKKFLF